MRTAYSLVALHNREILLVRKGEFWILPGGKPKRGESPSQCLIRECSEELPGTQVTVKHHYGEFRGKTPHGGHPLVCTVYFGTISGELKPGAEIVEVKYFDVRATRTMKLSDVTQKIVQRLFDGGYI